MIEQINLVLANESGDFVPIRAAGVEMKIETAIADLFSEICRRNNDISDAEIKTAEKFNFCLNLKNYLEEMKKYVDRTAD